MNQTLGNLSDFYEGKNILVSGGSGSIGKWIVRRLIEFKPKVIRILDNDENGLFEAQQEFQKYGSREHFTTKDRRTRISSSDFTFVSTHVRIRTRLYSK